MAFHPQKSIKNWRFLGGVWKKPMGFFFKTSPRFIPPKTRTFFKAEDWSLVTAGQRVQIMKRDPQKTGATAVGHRWVYRWDRRFLGVEGKGPRWTQKMYWTFSGTRVIFQPWPPGDWCGGFFKYFLEFSPRKLGKMKPFLTNVFSNGLVQPPTSRSLEGNLPSIMAIQV